MAAACSCSTSCLAAASARFESPPSSMSTNRILWPPSPPLALTSATQAFAASAAGAVVGAAAALSGAAPAPVGSLALLPQAAETKPRTTSTAVNDRRMTSPSRYGSHVTVKDLVVPALVGLADEGDPALVQE